MCTAKIPSGEKSYGEKSYGEKLTTQTPIAQTPHLCRYQYYLSMRRKLFINSKMLLTN